MVRPENTVASQHGSSALSGVSLDDISVILVFVSWTVISGLISLFGIITNAINLIIFFKQGFSTTTNISFFALAISDTFSLLASLVSGLMINPLTMELDIAIYTPEAHYLAASWPHVCFTHITCWITAYITAERFLCISFPLKIKRLITPKRTTWLLCIIYIVNLLTLTPEYACGFYVWRFFPERNRTILGLGFTDNRPIFQIIFAVVIGLLGLFSFPVVIIFTAILIVKMKQQTAWRNKSTAAVAKQSKAISKRDLKAMNLVILIAAVLIVCFTPGTVAAITTSLLPQFDIGGSEVNWFLRAWGVIFIFEAINSSVNIFLYYKMSTKYRNSFHELFGICTRQCLDYINVSESNDNADNI